MKYTNIPSRNYELLFICCMLFISISFTGQISNPGNISGGFPKPILSSQNTMYIFTNGAAIQTFSLQNGIDSITNSYTNNNLFEIGVTSFDSFYACTQLNSNKFSIRVLPPSLTRPGTKINEYEFSSETICLFSYSDNGLSFGYAVWINNEFINLLKFDSRTEIKHTIFSGRKVGTNIDCKIFLNEIACVYTGKEAVDNDSCFFHIFTTEHVQQYSERELGSEGCYNSPAQKIFKLDDNSNYFYICYIRDLSLYCIKSLHNYGYYETKITGTLIMNGCKSNMYNFDIGKLNTYIIAVCANGNNIYMKQFDENFNGKEDLPTYTIDNSDLIMPSIVYFDPKNTVMTYYVISQKSGSQYFLLVFPECIDFSLSTTINENIKIDFDNNRIDNSGFDGAMIQLISLPSKGTIYNIDTQTIEQAKIKTNYALNSLTYTATYDYGTFEFSYLAMNSFFYSSECKVSIIVNNCFMTCYTCYGFQYSTDNHDCKECDINRGYYEAVDYPVPPGVKYCVNRAMAPSNYYFNTGVLKFYKCDQSCDSCVDNAPSQCTKCAAGYHWENVNRNSCVSSAPAHTYLDADTDTYLPCYSSCDTCNEQGTINKHNCLSCLNDGVTYLYFPIEGYPTNCVNETTKPTNYYLHNTNSIYKKCDESCETCSISSKMCGKCAEYYYRYEINNGHCVNEETKDENYYFDYIDEVYKQCDPSCKTCSAAPDGSTYNCLSCPDNVVKKYLSKGNCEDYCPSPTFGYKGYCVYPCPDYTSPVENYNSIQRNNLCIECPPFYLYEGKCIIQMPANTYIINTNFNILAKCYPNCKSCYGGGTITNMKCTDCAAGFYPLSDKKYNCYDNVPDYYYKYVDLITGYTEYRPCYESCLSCNEAGSDYDHQCKFCREGYVKDPYSSKNCYKKCEFYWYRERTFPYKYQCTITNECPSNYPYLYEKTGECAISCNHCYGCKDLSLFDLDNKCVEKCTENSIEDKGYFKCHTTNDIDSLINYGIHNYITEGINNSKDQPNKYLLGNETNFHLCNSTVKGIEDCKNISTHMGLSYMNLSDCFNVMAQIYHFDIDGGDYFYYAIFERIREDTTSPQVYYEIFDKTGVRLESKYCVNSKINITKSYLNKKETEDAVNIYNKYGYDILKYKSNGFYSDICKHFESDDKFDILLNDRYDFFYKNRAYYFCEENCKLTDIFPKTYEVFCDCLNKENTLNDVDFVQYEISKRLYKDNPLQYFKCANLVFSKWTFKRNIANYIIMFFFVLQIILCRYFYTTGRKPFFSFIHNKLLTLGNSDEAPRPSNPPKRVSVILDKVREEQLQKEEEDKQIGEEYAKIFIMNNGYQAGSDDEKPNMQNNNNTRRGNTEANYSYDSNSSDNGPRRRAGVTVGPKIYGQTTAANEDDEVSRLARQLKLEQQEKKFAKEVLVKYPDTGYIFLYSFCMKRKHRILSLLYNKDVYEIFCYKLSFLILSYSIDFLMTTMLYLHYNVRNLYHHKKHHRIIQDIGFGILSSLVSFFIIKFLKWLMEFKSSFKKYEGNIADEDKREYYNKLNQLVNNLSIKFGFYFFFTFIGTFFIWYFVCSFISTYRNTQLSWGISISANIIVSLVFPFIYYAFVVLLQYISLNKYKLGLYKVSMFLLRL